MEAQDFRTLVDQLGDLTEVQRAALAAALAGQGSANEAIAMIEMRFALAPACGHCKSQRFGSWGTASGLKRYMCRNCNRTFNALTGTPLAQLPKRCVARLCPCHGRPHEPAQGRGACRHLPRNLVSLATSVPTGGARQASRASHRHRRGGRDVHPEIGEGIEAHSLAGRPEGAVEAKKPGP